MAVNTMSFARYDLLPAEIHLSILQAIDDWATLQCLMRAYPQALQLYLTARDVITLSVMRNQISRSPILTCLTVLKTPLSKWFDDDQEQLLEVIEHWKSGKTTLFHDLSLEHAKYLLRLDRTIEYFIPDFTSTRLRVLDNFLLAKGLNVQPASCLSSDERSRLRLAFYHQEICAQIQRVFSTPNKPDAKSHVAWRATVKFLRSLGHVSIAEMMCVCQYIMDKALLHLDQVEDDLKQELTDFRPHYIEPDHIDNTWNNDDWFFGNDIGRMIQVVWIQEKATTPLLTLRTMLTENSPTTRLDDIRDGIYDSEGYNYLREILKDGVYPRRAREKPWHFQAPDNDIVDNSASSEPTRSVSKALSWAYGNSSWSGTKPQGTEGLRRWGYAIWDDERVERLGVLQFKSYDVASKCTGQLKERRDLPTVEDWSRVQEQIWKEQGLIDEDWRSIEFEDGSYFATVTGKNDILVHPA